MARSDDALALYQRKRDFALTPEPAGTVGKTGRSLSFVIQKHAARNLHYDFRLELDGTLKSWAVPKGPSLDPAVKRMAVEVEDHPLSYASFEGVIPPKQYGAGTVIVWDHGTWVPEGDPRAGHRKGKLSFELRGAKLNGRWTLVRMHRRDSDRHDNWLLIKDDDAHARPADEFDVLAALPGSVLTAGGNAKHPATAPPQAAAGKKGAARKKAPGAAKTPSPATRRAAKWQAGAEGLPPGAVPAALPDSLSPQLATLVDDVPVGDDWLYEIKFDGYRLVTRIEGDDVRCITRNGHDWSAKLPKLVEAVRSLGWPSGWLDGEILVAGADGQPSFQALQNAFDARNTGRIQYHVFDLPFYAGHDLRDVPLAQRRAFLRTLMRSDDADAKPVPDALRFSESFDADPTALLESARQAGLEGLIGKRKDAVYQSRRSSDWVKLKCQARQEFVVIGYTDPQGSRTGFGALLLAVHDAQGQLRYAGNVGTGFDEKTLADLAKRLKALKTERSALADPPRKVGARKDQVPHWVRPMLLAEVSFAQWTQGGSVRHAVFHGLRTDKTPDQITRENAMPLPSSPRKKKPAATDPGAASVDLRVTHPQRVIDAKSGVTKGGLVQFYASVAPLMLPHLQGRPVALMRAPQGVAGQTFFQKHAEAKALPHFRMLDPALDPGHDPLMSIESADALLSAAQMNVIELHTWNTTARAIQKPDRMVFDIDPGDGVPWAHVQEAAQLVRSFLGELGLVSFLKTSGGKGLHVVVPLVPRTPWQTVKAFSQAIVQHLARVVPSRFVAKSGPSNRVGRIFIDYLRNGFGATTVAAWSARARPGLGVSVPVAWDELDALTSGAHWTVSTVAARLPMGNQPWEAYASSRQGLSKAMKVLGFKPAAVPKPG